MNGKKLLFFTILILSVYYCVNAQFGQMVPNANNTFDIGQLLTQYGVPLQILQAYLQQNAHLFSLQRLNISAPCMNKTVQFLNALQSQEDWAIQVVDSWGKPASGIFNGGLNWVGEYRMCLNVTKYSKTWKSKYCVSEKPSNSMPLASEPKIKYGICVSDDCDKNDIVQLINFALDFFIALTKPKESNDYDYGISEDETTKAPMQLPIQIENINTTYLDCKEPKKFLPSAIIMLCILSLIVSIILIATVYDQIFTYLTKHENEKQLAAKSAAAVTGDLEVGFNKKFDKPKSTFSELMEAFSAINNAKKLFEIPKNHSEQFGCLNAIRVLSISWVVYCHTYLISVVTANNPRISTVWMKNFAFMAILNATYVVDTFFFMSGFLLCYLFMRQVQKQDEKITPSFMFKYYFHRLWRITPSYIIVVLISTYLSAHFGNGPFFPSGGFESKECRNSIWTNILYINNFVGIDSMCFIVSWYVSNDMQFHWVAPILLLPLALNKRIIGGVLCGLFLIVTILCNSLIINANPGYEMGMLDLRFLSGGAYFDDVYIKPWCRIGPFVIGIILGYIVYEQKKNLKFPKIDFKLNLIGWVVSLGLLGLIVFGVHGEFVGSPLSRPARIMYQTFSRIVWSIALAYITYACITSNGGIVNKLLSLPIWVPLSRLSFGVYLVHVVVILCFILGLGHPIYLQHDTLFSLCLGYIGTSFIFSFLLHIFVEAPFIRVEKFIFGNNK